MSRAIALIITADEPILFYDSIEAAESDIEAIDVKSGVYKEVFGPNGEYYAFVIERDIVHINLSDKPMNPERLRDILVGFLDRIGKIDGSQSKYPVSYLLKMCEPFVE